MLQRMSDKGCFNIVGFWFFFFLHAIKVKFFMLMYFCSSGLVSICLARDEKLSDLFSLCSKILQQDDYKLMYLVC